MEIKISDDLSIKKVMPNCVILKSEVDGSLRIDIGEADVLIDALQFFIKSVQPDSYSKKKTSISFINFISRLFH